MTSYYAPLTAIEKEQLRTLPNVHLIEAWTLVRGISRYPEVFLFFHRKIYNSKNVCIIQHETGLD